MIDNAFRAVMPRFVRPLLKLYGHLGWTPNHVTVLGFVIALFASAAVALHFWWLAFALWWLSRLAEFAIAAPELQAQWMAMLFLYVLCITTALSLGMQEAKRTIPPRDNRGLRLGAGLAEGGETGIAYSVFLLFPTYLSLATTIWIAVLIITVIARSFLAYQTLRPETPDGSGTTRPL